MEPFRKTLEIRLKALRIAPEELEERFRRSSGPGGQNVNKVETGVTLVHLPTGITVVAEDSRSRARNRLLALARLIERFEELRTQQRLAARAAAAKRRRQEARRSTASKREMLAAKRHRSGIKKQRTRPSEE